MNKKIKFLWVTSGILIFLWTAFWFWKVRILNEYGIVGNVIKLAIGNYLLALYIIIAIVYGINKAKYKKKTRKLRKSKII